MMDILSQPTKGMRHEQVLPALPGRTIRNLAGNSVTGEIKHRPLHPYRQALTKAFPTRDLLNRGGGIMPVEDNEPSPITPRRDASYTRR